MANVRENLISFSIQKWAFWRRNACSLMEHLYKILMLIAHCCEAWHQCLITDHSMVTTSDDECQVWSASVEWSKWWCPAVQSLSVITSLSSSTSANTSPASSSIVKLHNNIQLPMMPDYLWRLFHKIIQRRVSTRSLFVDFFPTVW